MRFPEMAGYYRKFCNNLFVTAGSLTNLLNKRTKFYWNETCQEAFNELKAILKSEQVLFAPNFEKKFKLSVDASDICADRVL